MHAATTPRGLSHGWNSGLWKYAAMHGFQGCRNGSHGARRVPVELFFTAFMLIIAIMVVIIRGVTNSADKNSK